MTFLSGVQAVDGKKINNVLKNTGEHDFSQHFACYSGKEDATFCSITILLVHKNNVGIFPFQWETPSEPAVKDKIIHFDMFYS